MGKKMVFLGMIIMLLAPPRGIAQQVIEEEMKITSVRVQVRVFDKGQLVKNLKKRDFEVFEGGVPQKIDYFYRLGDKIGSHDIEIQALREAGKHTPRYFVLIFRVFEMTRQLKNGVNVFFNNILRKGDEVLIFANDKTLFFKDAHEDLEKHKEILIEVLLDQAHRASARLMGYLYNIRREWDIRNLEKMMIQDFNFYAPRIVNFLDGYLDEWRFFKKTYLIPDTNKYYNFAQHLQKISKQKWVINFYQLELFPKLKVVGTTKQQIEALIGQLEAQRPEDALAARQIRAKLQEINRELSVVAEFPVQELSKLFYKVNTTFHSIFMNISKEAGSENFEFKQVSSDLENCFREITKSTGGELMLTNDISSALHSISKREDYYYILSYTPRDPEALGRIRVRVKGKNYQVLYDDNQRKDYINEFIERQREKNPIITIRDLKFENRALSFDIRDFFKLDFKGRQDTRKGNILVRIKITDDQGELVYNDLKAINPRQENVHVSVEFEWLDAGKYYITVDAADLINEKSAMEFIQTEIRN